MNAKILFPTSLEQTPARFPMRFVDAIGAKNAAKFGAAFKKVHLGTQ
ncbi:MAG: hypothetical protein JO230_28975 [Xanthobacteraceae bacterium]|nr:hypothetical protein [Xanthobacteraceae bacterium]